MAKPARKCSECPKSLRDMSSQAKTCSGACRSARSDRLKRARAAGGAEGLPEHLGTVSQVVTKRAKSATHEVLKEELRPIVREALTKDVLDGLGELVELVPEAIRLIGEDFNSGDETIRQRAYTLLLKYTVGNTSIAPASQEVQPAPMQVVFAMPRPGDVPSTPAEAEELVVCESCGDEKPRSQMVANSERCQSCHDEVQARVNARFPKPS